MIWWHLVPQVFAQMGEMLMRNPAVMQQAQQLVPAAAVATGSNATTAQDGRAEPCTDQTLPPFVASSLCACARTNDKVLRSECCGRVQDEDKMIEEALRRSMEEMNYGTGSSSGDASGDGSA